MPDHDRPEPTITVLNATIRDADTLRFLNAARERLGEAALSEVIGRELPELLKGAGFHDVRCPACAQVSLEADVAGAKQDTWQCPHCGKATHFMEWTE
ncbi:hypothetical protein [Deinococcus aluminii]|uniref:Uncharacterized protein n=1 Tax=Deinococcus aluminii TaxID=1656885 RepID=A0ABP9XEM3_9DEIO